MVRPSPIVVIEVEPAEVFRVVIDCSTRDLEIGVTGLSVREDQIMVRAELASCVLRRP